MNVEAVEQNGTHSALERTDGREVQVHFYLGQGLRFTFGEKQLDFRSVYNNHASVIRTTQEEHAAKELVHLPVDEDVKIDIDSHKSIVVVAEDSGFNRNMRLTIPNGVDFHTLPPEDDILEKHPESSRI